MSRACWLARISARTESEPTTPAPNTRSRGTPAPMTSSSTACVSACDHWWLPRSHGRRVRATTAPKRLARTSTMSHRVRWMPMA